MINTVEYPVVSSAVDLIVASTIASIVESIADTSVSDELLLSNAESSPPENLVELQLIIRPRNLCHVQKDEIKPEEFNLGSQIDKITFRNINSTTINKHKNQRVE